MEGIIYTNDSRIVEIIARKHLSDTPKVTVKVEEVKS
jgi:Holliday junction resolvase RusA-like endonuclease